MAVVTAGSNVLRLDAQGDQILENLCVKSVRFVATTGQLAADEITLTDPVDGNVLWRTYGGSAIATEAELVENRWTNGVILSTMTGDRGEVYINYK